MKTLIVVTNPTAPALAQMVAEGKHQRTDYMALGDSLGAPCVKYDSASVSQLEERLRLNLRQAWTVRGMVRRNGYEAVLSMSERVGIPLAYLLPRRIRHVVILHHPLSPTKLKMMQALRLGHRFARMLVLSEAEAKALRQRLAVDDHAVRVLRFPTDTEFYRPQEVPLQRQDHLESVGFSHRDYPTLLRAMRRLPHIPCYLHPGSLWTTDKAGVDGESLPDNVHVQPFVQPDALRGCYAQSRFVVVPMHQTTYWSAGSTAVQEAQAMGKAVVATRLPGLSEYVVDGETGLLVPVGDHQAMAAAIEELWSNPQKATAMGRAAREWIVANFSLAGWVRQASQCFEASARER